MNQARVQLLSIAVVGIVLGLVLGLSMPTRGQETPQNESPILQRSQPPAPTVKVEPKGRLLVLSYDAAATGQAASTDSRGEPPRFAIYQGQRQIAAGQFEYG